MKVHKITTKYLQDLRDCIIGALDEHLNFYVGPGRSGKTSLFRTLSELKESFEVTGTRKPLDYLYSVHSGSRQIGIDVKVSWDTYQEGRAVGAFLYASLSTTSPLNEEIKGLPDPSAYQITSEKSALFSDWLILHWGYRCRGVGGSRIGRSNVLDGILAMYPGYHGCWLLRGDAGIARNCAGNPSLTRWQQWRVAPTPALNALVEKVREHFG